MGWIIVLEVLALLAVSGLIVREMVSAGAPADGPAHAPPGRDPDEDRSLPLPKLARPRLLVEKSLHRLTVYDGGAAVKSYRCAIGGGRGDKVREGDRCTPEGTFYVCVRNPQSRYVLSLGLSYPNEEDAERGLREGSISQAEHDGIRRAIQKRRQPPWDTALGGEIMIHGCGAGRDWTLGCIALDDEDIRELYPAIPLGTEVEIRP